MAMGALAAAVAILLAAGCAAPQAGQESEEPEDTRPWRTTPVAQTTEDDFSVAQVADATYERRYFYNQLSPDRQHQYRMLYKALMAHVPSAEYAGAYEDGMQEVARSLFLDCPEFFYARMGGTYESDGTDTSYKMEYVYNAKTTYERRARIAGQVEAALQAAAAGAGLDAQAFAPTMLLNGTATGSALPSMDGYTARQAAWAIDAYLADHIDYHWEAADASDEDFYDHFYDTNTLYGALVDGHAMCGGYSQAFAYLCYQLGIPCVYVEGNVVSDSFTGAHAWDMAQIDGAWGVVDPTWTDDESGIGLRDDYFMSTGDYHDQYVTDYYVPAELPAA